MQFQVPQFIETEDKIVGPLTLKQFLYAAGSGGFCFMLFFQLQFWLWVILTAIIGGITIAFIFVKVNGRPLPAVVFAALAYYWHPRLYLWKSAPTPESDALRIKLPEKRGFNLENLWQQLTTSKAPIPEREKTLQPSILDRVKSSKERFEIIRRITGDREVARRIDYR